MRVLITGAFSSLNRGDEARVKSSIRMIQSLIPNAIFEFLSAHPVRDQKIYQEIGLRTIHRYKYGKHFKGSLLYNILKIVDSILVIMGAIIWRLSNGFMQTFRASEFAKYEIIMDLSGESLSNYFGQKSLFLCLHPILLGIILKKPVVIFAQSIGPFGKNISGFIGRYIINRVNLITVRDRSSFEYLELYGINRPAIYLTADPAFVFEPKRSEQVDKFFNAHQITKKNIRSKKETLVGICVSRGGFKRTTVNKSKLNKAYEEYVNILAKEVDRLIEKFNAFVIFVPHVIQRNEDDRATFDKVFANVRNKNKFKLVSSEYGSEELKAIIGECDVFIGSRMHANVAALSSCVPVIAIAYSHKMPSLMERFGLKEFCLSIEMLTQIKLHEKIEKILNQRNKISEHLELVTIDLKKISLMNATLIDNLIKGSLRPEINT